MTMRQKQRKLQCWQMENLNCLCARVPFRGWYPNDWSDCHQTWHRPRLTPKPGHSGIENDVSGPEVSREGPM